MAREITHVLVVKLSPFPLVLDFGQQVGMMVGTSCGPVLEHQKSFLVAPRSIGLWTIPDPHVTGMVWIEPRCTKGESYNEGHALGLFLCDDLAVLWARAFLFNENPQLCPQQRKPVEVDVRTCQPSELLEEVLKREPVKMTKWLLSYPETKEVVLILAPHQKPTGEAKRILAAHYCLANQTRLRVEKQVETQLGAGEAAKRIFSAFARDYGS